MDRARKLKKRGEATVENKSFITFTFAYPNIPEQKGLAKKFLDPPTIYPPAIPLRVKVEGVKRMKCGPVGGREQSPLASGIAHLERSSKGIEASASMHDEACTEGKRQKGGYEGVAISPLANHNLMAAGKLAHAPA